MRCRFCGNELKHVFIDLVNSPPSNSFLTEEQLDEPEVFYPLKTFVCEKCFLVQIAEYKKSSEIFNNEYVYFSSYSNTMLQHSKRYVDHMINRFKLNEETSVIEIASNDGYLLQYFKDRKIPVLGIEPTSNTAAVARQKGIETIVDFFGKALAQKLGSEGRKADLIVGNNVLAHVPDINDFVSGLKIILSEEGIITLEFPHLLKLIENNEFDTIYHEHYSYLSFLTVKKILEAHELEIFDVDELEIHGGSLRIYAKHKEDNTKEILPSVNTLLSKERNTGIERIEYYSGFQKKVDILKEETLTFLIGEKRKGKKIIGYGAAAKANTFINYYGIKKDLIEFIIDVSPHKQNKFLPGSHIRVFKENIIKQLKPDYIIIFPWNLKEEIVKQLDYIQHWGGKFITCIPQLDIT